MQHDSLGIEMDDGQALHVYRWLPEGAPRATVLLVHGIAEHAGRYQPLGVYLAGLGYAVYAHDQRGHGRSARSAEALGFVSAEGGWRRLLRDIQALRAHMDKAHPGLPRVLFGHSMGSLLAQNIALDQGERWDGVVLQASNYRPDPLPRLGQALAALMLRLSGPRRRSRLLDFLTIGVLGDAIKERRSRYDWLNRDPAEVDAYIADPLCGFSPTVALWRDLYGGTRRIAEPRAIAQIPKDLPVLLLVGGDDGLSDGGRRVRRLAETYRGHGLQNVELRVYPGARHELHREINRAEVFQDLAAWLEARIRTARMGSESRIISDGAGLTEPG